MDGLNNKNKPLIIIAGPTAVGKTALGISLAKKINGEIISADSMQVYRHMDIGTAKAGVEEMSGIKHYLIDILEPTENFDVYTFKQMAEDAISEIYSRGCIPIIVGGTGFYIQSVLYDIDFEDRGADDDIRRELEALVEKDGKEALHNKLRALDPEKAEKLSPNDVKRVIRSIEFAMQTGEKISNHNESQRKRISPYNFSYFVLNDDRAQIYERINRRVDEMMKAGLLDEVIGLKNMGCTDKMTSMKAIGYRQLLGYLNGAYDLDTAVDLIKRDSRHFAKRQLTWFNREPELIWIDRREYPDTDSQTDFAMRRIYENGID